MWSKWLEATQHYCKHFEKCYEIISNLDTETSAAIDGANYSLVKIVNLEINFPGSFAKFFAQSP